MTPRNIFWFTSALACVGVAVSAVYFMLVYIPNRDRLQAETAAENARATRFSQLDAECANRAKTATQQFLMEQRVIGASVAFIGSSNHYNRQLQKCIVEVDTLSSGSYASTSSRDYMDAYENTILMSCWTVQPHDRKKQYELQCQDADLVRIPQDEEDKRWKALMRE